MNFAPHKFSRRFPEVECAILVVHEKPTHYRGTAAAIITKEGGVYIGVTLCAPGDQYVKKIGRAKAIGRAAQNLCLKAKFPQFGFSIPDNPNLVKSVLTHLERAIHNAKHINGFI